MSLLLDDNAQVKRTGAEHDADQAAASAMTTLYLPEHAGKPAKPRMSSGVRLSRCGGGGTPDAKSAVIDPGIQCRNQRGTQVDNGQVIYRHAYPETDSMHVVSSGRSEEFLFLENECAPREFEYELSELSAGARVELAKGEVHFTNKTGHGVKIEAPWLIEATGARRAGAVRWELEESKSGAPLRLRLVVVEGLSYPVVIDPSC